MPGQVATPRPATPRQRRFVRVLRRRANEPEGRPPETALAASAEIDRLVKIVGRRR